MARTALFTLTVLLASAAFAEDVEIPLWPKHVPGAKGDADVDKPTITPYLPAEGKGNGCAVVVCPGGGYFVHAIDHEGAQVARWLNRHGVAAFVLKYRLKKNGYTPDHALLDVKRAVRWVRAGAKKYNLATDRIGVLGFSAGGHLASRVGVSFDMGEPGTLDPVESHSSRPDFLVLGYPVIDGALRPKGGYVSTYEHVNEKTPPAFLWHTDEDRLTSMHSLAYYTALKKAGVRAELHVFARGPHGLGLAPGDPRGVGQWPALTINWMRQNGYLTGKPRVEVSGRVTIDGKPLHRGWVTLTPVDAPGRPVASAYITHKADGKFTIDAERGPCAGPHRVTVHVVAQAFLTSPSMADAEVITRAKSGGATMTTNIDQEKPTLELDLTTR